MSEICFKSPEHTINYHNNSKLQYKWGIDLLEKCKHLFEEDNTVLDVGCGNGNVTTQILKYQPKIKSIIGIDGSADQIDFAIKNNIDEVITYQIIKLNEINFVNKFNIVFGCCIFHWVSDQQSIFAKIYQALKNNGKFMFVGPAANAFNISVISEALIKTNKWKNMFVGFNSNRSYHTREEYNEILTQVGFEVIDIRETKTITIYDNVDALKSWMRPLSVHSAHLLTDLEKEEFLNDIVTEMLNMKLEIDSNGKIVMSSVKVEVLCCKN